MTKPINVVRKPPTATAQRVVAGEALPPKVFPTWSAEEEHPAFSKLKDETTFTHRNGHYDVYWCHKQGYRFWLNHPVDGVVGVEEGCWIVNDEERRISVLSDEVFHRRYQQVE